MNTSSDETQGDVVGVDPAAQDLDRIAESLAMAVRSHVASAQALTNGNRETAEAVQASRQLAGAVRAYADAAFGPEAAAWLDSLSGEFGDEDSDHDDDDDADDDADEDELSDGLRLSLEARWDFVIADADSFLSYVEARHASEGCLPAGAARAFQVATGLGGLFDLDGWPFDEYEQNGLQFAGSGFTVHEIATTLFEMDDEERDRLPF